MGMRQRAWARRPGPESLSQRAYAKGLCREPWPGPRILGHGAWARGAGPGGFGQKARLRGPDQGASLIGLVSLAWAIYHYIIDSRVVIQQKIPSQLKI